MSFISIFYVFHFTNPGILFSDIMFAVVNVTFLLQINFISLSAFSIKDLSFEDFILIFFILLCQNSYIINKPYFNTNVSAIFIEILNLMVQWKSFFGTIFCRNNLTHHLLRPDSHQKLGKFFVFQFNNLIKIK